MNIVIKNIKEVERYFGSLNQNAKAAMKIEITDMANKVKSEMQADAPVDVARLKNAISYKQKDLNLTFVAQSMYAPYMEFGTKKKVQVPSWVGDYAAQFKGSNGQTGVDSLQAITSWVKRKGLVATFSTTTQKRTRRNKAEASREKEAANKIWWSIMKNGVKPHPFFFTTKNGQNRIEIIKERYIAAINQGLKNIQP